MGLREDLRELRRVFGDLLAYGHDDEDAGYELASSARRFSRRTKEVVDDKLSFSATLMRAGEVHAANRLLAEVESDVRNEESALIERVNEVKTAAAARRERVTRVRLARTLVAASISVGLMSFSAIGMAVAGWLEDRDRQANVLAAQSEADRALEAERDADVAGRRVSERKVKIAGVRIDNKLSPAEMRTLNRLTAASDGEGIEQLLLGVLSPDLARKVREVLVKTTAAAESAGETVEPVATDVTKKVKKKAKKAKSQTEQPKPEPTNEPSEEPSGGGGGGGSGDDDGDSPGSGGGEEQEDESSPVPPFPGI